MNARDWMLERFWCLLFKDMNIQVTACQVYESERFLKISSILILQWSSLISNCLISKIRLLASFSVHGAKV